MPLSSFTEQKVNYIASLIPIIIVTVLTACQKDERVILLPSPSIDYGRYFLYDTKCQRKRGISHDKIRFVSEEEGVTYTLTDAGGTTSLQTPLIAQTFYGNVFQRRCYHYNKKTGNCFDRDLQPVKWQHFKNSGGQLRICAQNEQYPRDSFEYVALRSAYHLQDAHRFYQESVGKSVPTMSLQILPFFRTFYQSEQISTYALRHNNIVYFPHSKTMAVLPEGENFQGKSLWDSPYVMAHEFAHHAQYYVLLQHNIGSVAFTKTQKKNKQSAEAFLEGWADLFAYYATGENPHLISTYPCFGFNRDISNHLFHDRTPKIITHAVLDFFYQGGEPATTCSQPDYTDSHIIGAVFAHHLHTITEYVLSHVSTQQLTPTLKYSYLHRWLQDAPVLANSTQNDKPFVQIIQHIYQQVRQTLPANTTLEENVCELFERGFPAISGCRR